MIVSKLHLKKKKITNKYIENRKNGRKKPAEEIYSSHTGKMEGWADRKKKNMLHKREQRQDKSKAREEEAAVWTTQTNTIPLNTRQARTTTRGRMATWNVTPASWSKGKSIRNESSFLFS